VALVVELAWKAAMPALPRLNDPDVWWVAAAGRRMLAEGHVPTQNVFSFVDGARPWVMHEWLYGPLYAWGLERFGPAFLGAVGLTSCLLIMALLLHATVGRCRSFALGCGLAALALQAFDLCLRSARPSSISMVFPVAMATLAFHSTWSRRHAAAAVALVWLWANCHGSFPLGPALLAASAVANPTEFRSRALTAVIAGAATLINPYGIHLHGLVAGYLAGQGNVFAVIHDRIREFWPLWRAADYATPWALLGLAVVIALAVAATLRRGSRVVGLLTLGLALMAIRQARHIDLAGLIGTVLLAPVADGWLRNPRNERPRLFAAASWGLGAAVGLLVLVTAADQPLSQWLSGPLGQLALPTLVPKSPGARLFVPFTAGGLAIWEGDPLGVKVFYDSRNDCYAAETARAALDLEFVTDPREVRSTFDHFGVDHVLVPDDGPVGPLMKKLPEWLPSLTQSQWTLYVRAPDRGSPPSPGSN
jgi:hypothetical protein